MGLYCGVDLHSTNSYLAVLDEQLQPVFGRRVPNRLDTVLEALEPFREQLQTIAVESTFNWYWLVDGLMEAGYRVQLVNTSAVRQYEGLKYVDDRHDARWLARLLHLGIEELGAGVAGERAAPARPRGLAGEGGVCVSEPGGSSPSCRDGIPPAHLARSILRQAGSPASLRKAISWATPAEGYALAADRLPPAALASGTQSMYDGHHTPAPT